MTSHSARRAAPASTRRSAPRRSGGLRRRGSLRKAPRRVIFETLEARTVLAALPYGAMPDDTGEYMLGDVLVTVVLMESNNSIDNGTITYPGQSPISYTPENWTAGAIAAVKSNIEAGVNWWKDTLDALPDVRDGLLNFTFDWTHADNPVLTGYEPIARRSNDFSLWMYDFLGKVGFDQTLNFSTDIRAYNNFRRQQANADWAFTIFVVNDAVDGGTFAPGGDFSQAFAFAGGRFMVVPASRPASTFAHEAGHMFWAFDEYLDADGLPDEYLRQRGYYATQNTNAADNPAAGFVQQPSIMTNGPLLETAYAGHTSSDSSLEMIGWRDSDANGIFDVLDVPFTLTGVGRYDLASGRYKFTGDSSVQTLLNKNPAGLQNDITINRIRVVEFSIDDGPWTVYQTFPDRTYKTSIDLSIPLSPGEHTIKIRTHDTRTGVMSPEFIGTTNVPSSIAEPSSTGASGFVFFDSNGNGSWDNTESPLVDWAVELIDENGGPVVLQHKIEPNDYPEGTTLNGVNARASVSAIGSDADGAIVQARSSLKFPSALKTFWGKSIVAGGFVETWTSSTRQMRVDFTQPVTSVSLRALSAGPNSMGRLSAFNAAGQLIGRYTTAALGSGKHELMSIARPVADIAYVIAGGHAGREVVLDTLTWGPGASATTNVLGAWRLPYLEGGVYRVTVTPPGGHVVTTPASGVYTVGIVAGQAMGDLNFGLRLVTNVWHNLAKAENVTGDPAGVVNVLDLLAVINRITLQGTSTQLPTSGDVQTIGYVDVNNDGLCNVLDLLAVINYITLQFSAGSGGGSGGSGEGESGSAGLLGASQGSGSGEGEQGRAVSAAEYFAGQPLHIVGIAGDDELCHDHAGSGLAGHDHAGNDHADDDHADDFARLSPITPSLARFNPAAVLLLGEQEQSWTDSPRAQEPLSDLPAGPTGASAVAFSANVQPALPGDAPRREKLNEAIDLLAEDVAESLTIRRLARRALGR